MDPFLSNVITCNESIREAVEEKGEFDLNCAGERSRFIPLHYAVEQWNMKAIEELLALGADINVKNDEAQNALQHAICESNYDVKDVQLDTIKLLVEKGIEVPEDILLSPLIEQPKIVWVLIRNVKNTVLKLYDPSCMEYPGEYDPLEHFLQDVTETEIDIVTHYLNHPEFELNIPTSSRKYGNYVHPGYKNAIEAFMKLEQCENAMKVVVLLHNGVGHSATWNSQDSDQATDITVSKIFDNMTDFSYVDSKGTKLVDMIFGTYIREICKLETRMGRKLLELGADENILREAFMNIRKIDYSIESYSTTLEKLVDTGINLYLDHTYKDESSEEMITIELRDQAYLAAAEFGSPKVLAEAIEKGADIFQNFHSTDQRSSIELIINPKDELTKEREEQKYDECLEMIMKAIKEDANLLNLKIVTQRSSMQEYFEKSLNGYDKMSKAFLLDLFNKKLEKDGTLLVDYLKENGKSQVLSNIGFLPPSPTNLRIDMGRLSCELTWECGDHIQYLPKQYFDKAIDYPVTGFRVQIMEASEAEDLQANLNQVLANHSTIGILWEQIGFKEQLDQALTEIYTEFDWEEMKNKLWKNTWLKGAFEEFPELEREVDKVLQAKDKDSWKTVCELVAPYPEMVGGDQTSINVSTLKYGSRVKFCVFAENQNGFSVPNIGTEYHKVLGGKPDPPGKPDVEIKDGHLFIEWAESDTAKLTGVKMYRVEWSRGWFRVLGKVYAGFDTKLCVSNFFKYQGIIKTTYDVRVIAVNDEGESEPSEETKFYEPCE